MTIFSAETIEPFRTLDGELTLGYVEHEEWKTMTMLDVYNEKITSGSERQRLLKYIGGIVWPLPTCLSPGYAPAPDELPSLEGRIKRYLSKYVWLSDDRAYDLLACWVIGSYFRDSFRFFPLIILDGATSSGKSRLQEALASVAYHGFLAGSYSGASIVRLIKRYRISVFLDEALDNIAGDRGADLQNLIKSVTSPTMPYVRAVPKTRDEVEVVNVYSSMTISTKGAEVAEDIINRGLRVQMLPKAASCEVGDLRWAEDDEAGTDLTPSSIRNDLYSLMIRSMTGIHDGRLDLLPMIRKTLTTFSARNEMTGQWLYGEISDIKNAPRITNRLRDIASTLMPIARLCLCDRPVMQLIIAEEQETREAADNSLECKVFRGLVDCIETEANGRDYVNRSLPFDGRAFREAARHVTTRQVAQRVNDSLHEEGEIQRNMDVETRKITYCLKTLGIPYLMGHGAGGRASTIDPTADEFASLFVQHLKRYDPEHLPFFKLIQAKSPTADEPQGE